jgi:hypothetical protein
MTDTKQWNPLEYCTDATPLGDGYLAPAVVCPARLDRGSLDSKNSFKDLRSQSKLGRSAKTEGVPPGKSDFILESEVNIKGRISRFLT